MVGSRDLDFLTSFIVKQTYSMICVKFKDYIVEWSEFQITLLKCLSEIHQLILYIYLREESETEVQIKRKKLQPMTPNTEIDTTKVSPIKLYNK